MKRLHYAPLAILICACSAWSTCPSETNRTWSQNSTIYYSTGNISGTELSQLQSALSDWGLANNNSGVAFLLADASHPAEFTFTNGTTSTGVGAATTITSSGGFVTHASTVSQSTVLVQAGTQLSS
jgi:hypothetical protein